jgi:hypothetical protein
MPQSFQTLYLTATNNAMKPHLFFLAVFFSFNLLSCNAQNSNNTATEIQQAEQALKQHPKDQQAWQQLYALMNENYTKLTAEERARLRKVLQQYGIWSTGTLYTSNEAGYKNYHQRTDYKYAGQTCCQCVFTYFSNG